MPPLRILLVGGLALAAVAAQAAPVAGALTAAEVKAQIVGHRVVNDDKTMTWYYNLGGKYDADDGRNGRSGTYTVGADGRLCWTEATGISGCFLYVRRGKALILRRVDPGHDFELGPVTIGPL